MPQVTLSTYRAALFLAAALLAGCGGSQLGAPELNQPLSRIHATTAEHIYILTSSTEVDEYNPLSSTPIRTYGGLIDADTIAVDSRGGLYVGEYDTNSTAAGKILVFKPKSTKLLRTVTDQVYAPTAIAVDQKNFLYSGNTLKHYDVTVYSDLGKRLIRTIPHFANTQAILPTNSSVIIAGGNAVAAYTVGGGKQLYIITKHLEYPLDAALGSDGNLYVTNCGKHACVFRDDRAKGFVSVFNATTGKFVRQIKDGLLRPWGIALDANNAVYVSTFTRNTPGNISIFAPGTDSPASIITRGIDQAFNVAVDANGNLYAANDGSSTVTVYASGSSAPSVSIPFSPNYYGLGQKLVIGP